MQGYRPIIAINILVLLILCAFIVHFAGFRGAGQATAGNMETKAATAKDATAKATTGSAVAAAVDDGVPVTAIAGSPDVILNFSDETVIATPFFRDIRAEDDARNHVEVHEGVGNNEFASAGQLYDRTTGKLWGLSMTTQAAYEVEELYLDAQHNRLYVKAIVKQGETASWGHFGLTGGFASTMEQGKKLELTTGDGVRRFFVLAGAAEFSGQ